MNNFKSLLLFSTMLSVAVATVFCSHSNAKTIWLEQSDFATPAQGDGDYQPTNFTLTEEEVSLQAQAMKPAAESATKETINDEKLPTLTSEGSFLLPTYILPEAKTDVPQTVASVDAQNPWRKKVEEKRLEAERKARESVTLNGIETPAPAAVATNTNSDKALLESIERQYQDTTALLENTSKRLAALEMDIENLSKNGVTTNKTTTDNEAQSIKETTRGPLLLPLAPIRTVSTSQMPSKEDVKTAAAAQTPVKREYVDYVLEVINRSKVKTKNFSATDEMVLRSIPKEMKISFLPEAADLSSQAFKWIKAFSYNPQRTVGSAVEVRLSPNNLDLQSRRFALIKGALLANGLAPRQIRFVFTDRDNDTVVLRNIQLPAEQEMLYQTEKNGKVSQQIIQKW